MVFAVRPMASGVSSALEHSGPIIPCGMRLVEPWSVASTAGGKDEVFPHILASLQEQADAAGQPDW
jgi:hypothetical protein